MQRNTSFHVTTEHDVLLPAAPVPDEHELNAPYSPPEGAQTVGPGLRQYARGENLAEQVRGCWQEAISRKLWIDVRMMV